MYHCITFSADEMYKLKDTDFCTNRLLSVGFCPLCNKPVAELLECSFTGAINKTTVSGINAHNMVINLKNSIIQSVKEINGIKKKSKPYGWKYGINKISKKGKISQFACDFYGNKELVKRK